MKKLITAVLLAVTCAAPSFAAKKPKQHHTKYNYRYRTPKMKVPKAHGHKGHAPAPPKSSGN